MKTLLLVVAITLLSCTKEEMSSSTDCNCTKLVSETISYTYFENGLPHLGLRKEFRYSEVVPCQDEVPFINLGDGMSYEIKCE